MNTTKKIGCARLVAAMLTVGLAATQAGNVFKANNSNNLNDPASWVGGATPTAADVAVWDNTVASASTVFLGANTNWSGIKILDPAGPVTISAGNALTNGAAGIDMSAAAQDLTLSNAVVLGVNQIWNIGSGRTLATANAPHPGLITGSGILTKTGNGLLNLRGLNTYSGGTIVNGGVLQINNGTTGANVSGTNSAGTSGITNNDGTTLRFGAAITIGTTFTANGTVFVDLNNLSGSLLLNGSWFGGGTVILTNASTGTTFTAGGNGVGGGSMNNFTGAVIVASTTSLGNPSTNAFRLNDSGGNNNTGNANASFDLGNGYVTLTTRNRSGSTINLGALSGGTNSSIKIGSSGSGGTTYAVGAKNAATTFAGILDGTGTTAGMFLALTKNGTNVFTLTGNNTYNGTTTINGGILQIGDGIRTGVGALGTGSVVVNAGGTLAFNKPDDFAVNNAISGAGTVLKQNGDTLTYNGADTSSGTLVIGNGTLVVGPSASVLCPVSVSSGGFFDVSQNPAFQLNQLLSGSGTVTGLLTAATGSIVPGGSGAAGTLSFSNGLTELGGINQQMELSSVGGTNDLINIVGDLTLNGTNNIIATHFGGGAIPTGTYTLINYTGNFNGGVSNLAVSVVGVTATLLNPANKIQLTISPSVRGATNLTWVGNGGANNWDVDISTNWVNGTTAFTFKSGDSVLFGDLGATNPTVNLPALVLPAAVVVNSASNYTFVGSAGIGGSTGLTKTNYGTLSVQTTNSYTGATVVGGGVLEITSVANGNSASAVGAAGSNPTNLVFYGSTLRYLGSDAATDRGATLNFPGMTFDIPSANLTLDGSLTGAGSLTKIGTGTLTLDVANAYTGGTVLTNGVLALGSLNANSSGLGTNSVTFQGGTLQLFGYNESNGNHYNALNNLLIVPGGQNGTLRMFSRGPTDNTGITSPLTGNGTLNLVVNYQRGSIDGDWSAFTGLINVTAKSGSDQFRTKSTFGYVNATIFLNDGVIFYNNGNANATIDVGELDGTSASFVGLGITTQNNAAANPTWRVGAKGTSSTYAGVIRDDGKTAVTKIGAGTWTLTGANLYTGSTIISNGGLSLSDGVTDGSIGSSTNINIGSGAFLSVASRVDGTLLLNSGQTLGGNGKLLGSLDLSAGGMVSPGSSIGALTVTNVVNLNGGMALMEINRSLSPNADKLICSNTITLGGTLMVVNIGPALHVGDTFTLFSTPLAGSFTSVALPGYYTWNTNNLAVNGTVSVTAVSATPSLSTTDFSQLSNGTITFNAINGAPNGAYSILTSTNLTLPLQTWTTLATGNFDGSGNISNLAVTGLDPTLPASFYILQAQ